MGVLLGDDLALVVIVAALLDGVGASLLRQVGVALADRIRRRVALACLGTSGGSTVTGEGTSLLVGLHVSVTSSWSCWSYVIGLRDNLLLRLLTAVGACRRGHQMMVAVHMLLALGAVIALVGLLLEIGDLLLQQIVVIATATCVVNRHNICFCSYL